MRSFAANDALSARLCFSFGIGTVGVSIALNVVAVYFPTLMSTVLGISPAVAGGLLMFSKLYDAFADLAIGSISDNSDFKSGRRRPFLLAGAFISCLALLAIFFVPEMPKFMLIGYMTFALIIHSTGYSLFNVPYLAMPAEMATSYEARLKLISFRTAFIALGQLLSLAITAALIEAGGGGLAGYRLMAGVMAAIALAGTVRGCCQSYANRSPADTLRPRLARPSSPATATPPMRRSVVP
jgi:GPH family glycoside/pentoside/hexuronide:cation symporter